MNRNLNYFDQAYQNANNYSNANGDWNGFVDNYNYANNADSAGQSSYADPMDSLPYVFIIANSTTADVSSVTILGANYNTVGATNNGNVAAITITMESGTYAQFLENIKSQPFKVGITHLESSNTSQPFKTLTFTQGAANGLSQTWPVTPKKDPNQQQSGVTILRNKYTVDAWTKISTTILGSATLTMSMYPMQELNVARGLEGRPVDKPYGAPNMSQFQLSDYTRR